MAFIDKTVILSYIKQDNLDKITEGDDSILTDPIAHAESIIREYLGARYNIDAVFDDATNTKYLTLRKVAIDIAIWNLYSGKVNPRHIPELRSMNYDYAMKCLDKYARGQIGDNLPENIAAEGEAREKAATSYNPFKDTSY